MMIKIIWINYITVFVVVEESNWSVKTLTAYKNILDNSV